MIDLALTILWNVVSQALQRRQRQVGRHGSRARLGSDHSLESRQSGVATSRQIRYAARVPVLDLVQTIHLSIVSQALKCNHRQVGPRSELAHEGSRATILLCRNVLGRPGLNYFVQPFPLSLCLKQANKSPTNPANV